MEALWEAHLGNYERILLMETKITDGRVLKKPHWLTCRVLEGDHHRGRRSSGGHGTCHEGEYEGMGY